MYDAVKDAAKASEWAAAAGTDLDERLTRFTALHEARLCASEAVYAAETTRGALATNMDMLTASQERLRAETPNVVKAALAECVRRRAEADTACATLKDLQNKRARLFGSTSHLSA